MRSLSRRINSLSLVLLCAVLLLAVCFPAEATDSGYIWCSLHDRRSTGKTVYFSGVFEGNASNSDSFVNAFNAWVHANFTDVRGTVTCASASDQPAARADLDHEKETERNTAIGTVIIQTDWTYTK